MSWSNFNYLFLKRVLDIIFAAIVIALTSPLMLMIGVVIILYYQRNPIFKQLRIGKNERAFFILKFRSMGIDGDHTTEKILGRILRQTSIDEFPQVFNIIQGDMSFVGPRPLLPEYLPYYNRQERLRHAVTPGITGLAQVSGRNSLAWGDRMELDLYYVKSISFWLDIKIVFLTIKLLFKPSIAGIPSHMEQSFIEYASKR